MDKLASEFKYLVYDHEEDNTEVCRTRQDADDMAEEILHHILHDEGIESLRAARVSIYELVDVLSADVKVNVKWEVENKNG